MWPFGTKKSASSKRNARDFVLYDVHSHILPAMDDGASSEKDSEAFLEKYAALGFGGIIVTPHSNHYMFETAAPAQIKARAHQLSVLATPLHIGIKAGAEIMLREDYREGIDQGRFLGVENAFLVEFENRPLAMTSAVDKVLYEFQKKGWILVLAHPERYIDVRKNPQILESLKKRGMLTQINLGSLVGGYGSRATELAWHMVQNGTADVVATDVHRIQDFQMIESAMGELEAYDKKIFKRLLSTNPGHLFNGESHRIEIP